MLLKKANASAKILEALENPKKNWALVTYENDFFTSELMCQFYKIEGVTVTTQVFFLASRYTEP